MQKNQNLAVKDLKLDLANFRTITQPDEASAIRAMIGISPDRFWGLTESLLADGYLPSENIIILKNGTGHVVKEGNRRVGALKIILGQVRIPEIQLPDHIEKSIKQLKKSWKTTNAAIPCVVYDAKEANRVDRVIALMHGKGELAARDNWSAVARARHNREKNAASEPGLDLLEKYLKQGQNLTQEQATRWAGVYPLSVLDEAIRRVAPRLGLASARELANQYPSINPKGRTSVESMLSDIGQDRLSFTDVRDQNEDFASSRYAFPPPPLSEPNARSNGPQSTQSQNTANGPQQKSGNSSQASAAAYQPRKAKALANTDPASVIRALKRFVPRGNGRGKLVALLEEARTLKIEKQKHCFCFVLRSMFELSAKAYCDDHKASGGPLATKASGEDRQLVDVLRDVEQHLTRNRSDKALVRRLHGAIAELAAPHGLFSITSLNQLIHNPSFSLNESHICTVFWNIFPLLEEMNR